MNCGLDNQKVGIFIFKVLVWCIHYLCLTIVISLTLSTPLSANARQAILQVMTGCPDVMWHPPGGF
jgi:hypothetical protein